MQKIESSNTEWKNAFVLAQSLSKDIDYFIQIDNSWQGHSDDNERAYLLTNFGNNTYSLIVAPRESNNYGSVSFLYFKNASDTLECKNMYVHNMTLQETCELVQKTKIELPHVLY